MVEFFERKVEVNMRKYFNMLYKDNFDKLKKIIENNIIKDRKTFIITANPETFIKAKNDEILDKMLLDKENLIVPDGIGIVKAANMLNIKVKERLPGIEIAKFLLEEANTFKKTVFLFGATKEVQKKMQEKIKIMFPNLKLIGSVDGYVENKDAIFEDMKTLKPDIVLVALGIPNQEKLIYKHLSDFDKGIFVGVGGSLDVISGMKKRAPKIFIKLNLEWLYRIVKEPKRIKRFYDSHVKFIFEVKKISKERSEKND